MNVNARIFGSDIPLKIKQKLEARQNAASGVNEHGEKLKPGDKISKYRDTVWNSEYRMDMQEGKTYQELLRGGIEAELSSRTPFTRMWTAVELRKEIDFGDNPDFEHITGFEKNFQKSCPLSVHFQHLA